MQFNHGVDVAIIGGGSAGTALALTLCLYSKLIVAVIERTAYDNIRIGENVSASLLPLLDYLQVKESFLADNHLPVYNVAAIWGDSLLHSRPSIFNQIGEGYLLDRGEFDAMLAEQVVSRGGQLYLQTKCLEGEQLDGGGWRLLLAGDSGESFWLEARYLVDATGRQSRIAKRLGAKSIIFDSLVGISAFLDFDKNKPKTEEIVIESVPEGWWYSAWLPDGKLSVVLMTDVDIMRQQRLHKAQPWISLLSKANHTSNRARGGTLIYPLAIKPAHSHILDRAVGEDWMAVGDACASFDPLSSMGIGHAMTSGSHAAVALIEHLSSNKGGLLKEYQSGLERNFETYLRMRHMYYEMEKRWLEAPFWKRRTKLTPMPVAAK
ncbi:lysine-epsilon-oxidase maturase LodB [Aetokthonos hydrillicola Thurmond2011]|jgi:flavin-dependent dehydrogenase|uniref:Lysine-epsilon-oxidase maturase LodB n=1 Tax=Aetokthonos hydrillicola Thurmond2011 TaxID=2712845 RepID=A0AAP5I3J1_9CYAN|nr:lysine-epsilon-oxidase maturase LodB [Aetokthonos hydrillicola]MBO3457315.1 NAD(P)/FAD-dependent oxidoreductase [Aetokthonos hydrillicola CCALA 1050]MBW4586663.1 lysine-epsilon-oxidase maturase LodB [Aetokthonos hydrillicola CCALA 1050]MDR9894010.1 lysine-epsilon-oxidase maturase LodB [Aetokthonos hydrillicola Thurmond2011]